MKNTIVLSAILFIAFVSIESLYANQVPTKGDWARKIRTRTLAPLAPIVYIEDDVVSIYLEDALQELFITIVDDRGSVIYQECISTFQASETHVIYLRKEDIPNGSIELAHSLGILTGFFTQNSH